MAAEPGANDLPPRVREDRPLVGRLLDGRRRSLTDAASAVDPLPAGRVGDVVDVLEQGE